MLGQESSVPSTGSKRQTMPKEKYDDIGSSSKRKGPIVPTGGFGVRPDSGERG